MTFLFGMQEKDAIWLAKEEMKSPIERDGVAIVHHTSKY